MNIRIVSTVGADEENRVAPALLKALAAILDVLPIRYSVRIETSDAKVYQAASKITDTLLPETQPPKSFDA